MIVYPAIDLIGGRCVRLRQGRFDDAVTYPATPAEALRDFESAGAQWAHVVDLDGARDGAPRQHDLIAGLAGETAIRLQVAGGFREAEAVRRMLQAGAERVIVGSLAVERPDVVNDLIAQFGADKIGLALDVRLIDGAPIVATAGWARASGLDLWTVAERFTAIGALIVTDIGRDGMMRGPNVALTALAARRLPGAAIQASGGVARLEDLRALRDAGAAGAIVGKALWEGEIDLAEAIDLARP